MASKAKRWRLSRDTVLFVVGVAGIIWETVVEQAERPTLLILFSAMIGLPAFLNRDEKRRSSSDEHDEADT